MTLAGEVNRGAQVHVDHLHQVRRRLGGDIAAVMQARIVDQHVNARERGKRLVDQCIAVRFVGDVHGDSEDISLRSQRVSECLQCRLAARYQYKVCTTPGKLLGAGGTHTRGRSGDNNRSIFVTAVTHNRVPLIGLILRESHIRRRSNVFKVLASLPV